VHAQRDSAADLLALLVQQYEKGQSLTPSALLTCDSRPSGSGRFPCFTRFTSVTSTNSETFSAAKVRQEAEWQRQMGMQELARNRHELELANAKIDRLKGALQGAVEDMRERRRDVEVRMLTYADEG
jgi:hypothetical protein